MKIYDLNNSQDFDVNEISEQFKKSGIVLFKNAGVKCATTFREFVSRFDDDLMDYIYRSSPRNELSKFVYNSTIYPEHKEIPLHNENSYSSKWPQNIWFYCHEIDCEGGETTICSSKEILNELSEELQNRLRNQGVRYRRVMGGLVDLSWQEVFQTEDKKEMEKKCDELLIKYSWDGDKLILENNGLGLINHPGNNQEYWFNQLNLFHPASLGKEVHESLVNYFGEGNLPRTCFWGNGEKFDDGLVETINASIEKIKTSVKWNKGDLLWVDNLKFMHGRKPFKGNRKIMVVMTSEFSGKQLVESIGNEN